MTVSPIKIQLKRLGKKKIKILEINLNKTPKTLKELIVFCVESEVSEFNSNRQNNQLVSFLTPELINQKSIEGKISFDNSENTDLADLDHAIENALQSYTDGLFAVFIDNEEIHNLNTIIKLNDTSNIAFLRLTFLTGTYW